MKVDQPVMPYKEFYSVPMPIMIDESARQMYNTVHPEFIKRGNFS